MTDSNDKSLLSNAKTADGSAFAASAVTRAIQGAKDQFQHNRPSAPPTTTAGAGDDLPSIPGLDSESAIARLAGNKKLYRKTLMLFCQSIPQHVQDLKSCLEQGDKERLQRCAHTVKGLCATIGAKDIANEAGILEHNVNADSPLPDPAMVQSLGDNLCRLEECLVDAGVLGDTPAPARAGNAQEGAQAVEKLRALLADDDATAPDYFAGHKPALAAVLSPEAMAKVEAGLRAYDFEEALEALPEAGKR